MSFLENVFTLITLASLFILGPAIGRAVISCFKWQDWSIPTQHLMIGICTMLAVSGLILAYGVLWNLSPASVAWYGWLQEIQSGGKLHPATPGEVRQSPKK